MDQESEVYSKDYERLQEMLTHYPAISIVSVEKDPPEQYVIEYKLFGYGYDANGDVQMLRRHQVQINLPFGYPHFPPTVKPLTKICHPDVAEHAVRIADYWQNNQSLADLVVYIGNMIRGEVYSTESAFNQQAAEWYQENQHKLPLAELEYYDPDSREVEAKGGSGGLPYRLIAGGLVLALSVTSGALFYRDKKILTESEERLQQVVAGIAERQFSEAKDIGSGALASLAGMLLLRTARGERIAEFTEILESTVMREGLQGRIEYQGQYMPIQTADALQELNRLKNAATELMGAGDLQTATGIYAAAVKLAEDHGFTAAANELRQVSAAQRLDYYVQRANSAYSEQKWQQAGEVYAQAIGVLQNDRAFLPSESLATLEKLEKLKALAMANFHTGEAVQAEESEMYPEAAEQYRTIVALVRRSPYAADPVLAKIAVEAEQERARVAEQGLVAEGTAYLLQNYKEIFKEHYPGLHGPALQSPRVRYMGRPEGKLVFIMSCIELIQRHSNEFRLYYQYDPIKRDWSIYRERK